MDTVAQRQSNNNRLVNRAGWLSIIGNVLLFALKYWAGLVSGSIALIADAWHTLSDSISSIIILIGLRIARRPPDKNHPFGHGRIELIVSIIVGVLLAMIAFDFLLEGVDKLQTREEVHYGKIAIFVTAFSILVKELLAQYAFRISKRVQSKALKADGWHHRSDAISSVIILIGIFVGRFFWWIDACLAIIVAGLIFYAAYDILRDAIGPLLGEKANEDMVLRLQKLSKEAAQRDIHLHHVHIHEYGSHTELTFHICLPPEMTIARAHDITSQVEQHIKQNLDCITTIHIDPLDEKTDCFEANDNQCLNSMKILILCTGNSCRSQMAEAFLKSMDANLDVHSAGTAPGPEVHPKAIQVMAELDIDLSGHIPKSVDEFLDQPFDYVVTVCDGAKENCPVFLGEVKHRLHIGFKDPAVVEGTEAFVLSEFRCIRDEIKRDFEQFYQEKLS